MGSEEGVRAPAALMAVGAGLWGATGATASATLAVGTASPVLAAAPVLAQSGLVTLVSGRASTKVPGSSAYVTLSGARLVPFGTTVDATHGTVRVTTALADAGGTQSVIFFAGQPRRLLPAARRRHGGAVEITYRVRPRVRQLDVCVGERQAHAPRSAGGLPRGHTERPIVARPTHPDDAYTWECFNT